MNIYAQNDTLTNYRDSLKIRTSIRLTINGLPENENELQLNSQRLKVPDYKKTDIDSSSLKSAKSLGNDSLKLNLKEKIAFNKDSTDKHTLSKNLRTLFPRGTVSLGYDYGFLPYTVNMPSPASAFKTEGLIETDIFNIPLDISYFYSTQKNLIGINNYFRISYNTDRYKDKLNTKLGNNLDSYKNDLGKLNSRRQQLMQKMAYADFLSSINPDRWPVDTTNRPETPGMQPIHVNARLDTSGMNMYADPRDTLKNNVYYSKADSLKQQALYYKHKKDSVAAVYEAYKNKYDVLNDSIKRVQAKIGDLEALTQDRSYSSKSPYLSKVQNFLSGIKKLDVGLCYPAYSTFLANNIPVRGISMEYQKNNRFFGLIYGTTVSTLLYANNNIEGVLQNVRNAYNYFDANNLSAGRKILSAKFGFGEKENDHFFLGFLVGKGANTYFPGNTEVSSSRVVESNLVVEADMRKKLSKNTCLDIVLGKSSVQDADLNLGTLRVAAKEIFSSYRSNAALVKLKTRITATKSDLTFSVRWVDPFFNSFGIGFLRSDNMRHEMKLDQPLSKSLRYTVVFRHEEDNLLRLLNYKNTFYSVNNTLSYKIRRSLVLRVGYTPLSRRLNGENYIMNSKSSIITGIVTFTPKSRTVQKQFSVLYNNYHVNTDSTPINFQNFSYYHQFSFKGGFKTGLTISWFKNNLKDTQNNDLFLAVLDVGYEFKNGSMLSVAGKSAYRMNGQLYPGFLVKSMVKLSKKLFWENQVEKFIIGDLFNGYDLENLKRFPYCYSTKLILNF